MRIFLICLLILGSIVSLDLYSYYYLATSTDILLVMTADLEKSVSASHWEEADEQLKKIYRQWQENEQIWSVLINHAEIDNIKFTLGRLESYIDSQKKAESLVENSALEHLIKHIPEKEKVSLANIF